MPEYSSSDLARWSGGAWSVSPGQPLTGFAFDTRSLRPGDMFVALRGERSDGHQHLAAARMAGAAAALVRRDTPNLDLPLLRVDDPRRALARLAAGQRARCPTLRIAVTGSTGKTTVKEMLADLLATRAPTARSRGNWNNDLGLPLSLLAMDPADRYGVFELGMNHPGELDPLCDMLQPQAAVVTSVGPVHIEYFQNEEAIAHEKAAVVRAVNENGAVVLPADDRWFDVLRSYVKGRLITTALRRDAAYRAVPGVGLDFTVIERATGQQVAFRAPLPGDYILHDALLAIALGRDLGLDWQPMVEALAAYRPVGYRWQTEMMNEVLVINDAYNANPASMRAALQAFAQTEVTGSRWLALGSMRELGEQARVAHLALGQEIAQGAWAGLLALGREGAWLAEGARGAGWSHARARVCESAAEAAAVLQSVTRPGDAVLLKASRGEKLENVLTAWRALGAS